MTNDPGDQPNPFKGTPFEQIFAAFGGAGGSGAAGTPGAGMPDLNALLGQVHLPIVRGSLLTAVLIVFVDTMKELPATLIMRPFDFDTLAVQAHRLASDERLAAAAVPSLVIAGIGLLPVVLLCRAIAGEGRGSGVLRARQSLSS